MPGPAPKDPEKRARRNVGPALKVLPADGRGAKRAPNWPLPKDPREAGVLPYLRERVEQLTVEREQESDGRMLRRLERHLDQARRELAALESELAARKKLEREIWTQLWRTPMAVEWERLRWHRTLARYCRVLAEAELGSAMAQREARTLEHAHGLTPMSLKSLLWTIAVPAEGAAGPGPRTGGRGPAWRSHLSAVPAPAAGS
ncbi:hypothetical protein [Thalassiella azotivora]